MRHLKIAVYDPQRMIAQRAFGADGAELIFAVLIGIFQRGIQRTEAFIRTGVFPRLHHTSGKVVNVFRVCAGGRICYKGQSGDGSMIDFKLLLLFQVNQGTVP